MISIIICSRTSEISPQLFKNIEETIGVIYELIVIHNPGIMGISKAYNLGASQTKYDNLLFLHEDVMFLNEKWGKCLSDLLADENFGVIGIAGSDYIPNCPTGWYNAGKNNYLNIEQFDGKSKFLKSSRTKENERAYLLDGVFLSMRRHWWNSLKFNEKISGFHGYDTDLTARSAHFKDNMVTNQVIISHYSLGKADKNWFINLLKIRKYYKSPSNQKVNVKLEIKNYYQFLNNLRQFKDRFEILFYSLLYLNPKYLGVNKSFNILKTIVYIFFVGKKF